eukprot:TRINITY_DN3113_c0_g1_i3.p1 TRINITY_DN3113_c0_g1~~TRINITY_DN3113_c0_g1_i3.p1  ORF type:complete len:184 (+),score=36.91 TRINITY_DN3113_c0_g1_i3:74-625(+)
MAISRDTHHKRKLSGGRRMAWRDKRRYQKGRAPSMTKLITSKDQKPRIRVVRTRGGNQKFRALRLSTGNFAWGSENCTRNVRIIQVVFNATSNGLVRTNTLVKGCIVQLDATSYRAHFAQKYGNELKRDSDFKNLKVPAPIAEQLASGRILACISSRPGQCGRADGYILEGDELQFYQRHLKH